VSLEGFYCLDFKEKKMKKFFGCKVIMTKTILCFLAMFVFVGCPTPDSSGNGGKNSSEGNSGSSEGGSEYGGNGGDETDWNNENGGNNGGNNGGSSEANESEDCTQGSYLCSGNKLMICGEDGTWVQYEQCSDDQACNSSKGLCEISIGGGGNGGGNNGGGNNGGGNNGGGNNGGGDNGGGNSSGTGNYSCPEIYKCQMNNCSSSDQDCQDDCFYKGTSAAQNTASTMYGCWNSYCADASDFSSCIDNNCYDETHNCPLYPNTDCPSIYDCLFECSSGDEDCQQACLNAASSEGYSRFQDLEVCKNENCSYDLPDSEYSNCVYTYCDNEIYKCGYRD